jgi:multidrug efflux pump subunit AcrB
VGAVTLSDVSIKNPVFAWMLMFGLIFFGFLCFFRMGLSQMPDVAFPVVNVSITLPNASAVIMESDVADVVEDAVLGVEGVQDVQTTCTQSNANISVFLDLSQDPNVAVQEVQTAVFAVEKQLPADTQPPIIREQDPNSSPVFWLAVTADPPLISRDMMLYIRDNLKDHYTKLPGVSGVFLGGWINRQVNIWVDNKKMTARYLTADDVVNTIQNQHAEVPVGFMETPLTQYEVRSMGEAATIKDFEDLPIITRGGQPNYTLTPLKDVATVEDGLATVTRISRFDGIPCVGLGIVMTDGYNAVKLVQTVKAQMAEDLKTIPKGYHLLTNFDTTVSIEENVHELELTICLAAILTGLVCYLFLGSWSSTFNVFLAIPTSLFGTFIIIALFGFTLNMFTLLALSLSIGVVVDDAIMVMENIMRHQEEGENMVEAALKGSREVIFAAVATSIAIVAIFLPVAFMSGIIGKFFFQFGITLSGAVLISLLEAVTLTPMRCSQFVHVADSTKGFNHWVQDHMHRLTALYGRFLGWCLGYRTDRLMAEARSGHLPWFKALFSKFFFTNPKALVADAQEEIKNPRYSLAPILWFIVGLCLLALAKFWKPLAFEITGALFLLAVLVYLWKNRHFFFAHLFYDHRWGVVFGAMLIFAGSMFLAKVIKEEMVPSTDQSVFMINLQFPTDYSIFRADGLVKQCEAALKPRGEIQNMYVAIGGFGASSSNTAIIFTTLKPPGKRPVATWAEKFPPSGPLAFISNLWNKFTKPRLSQAEFMEVCRKALVKVSPDLQVFLVDLSKHGLSTGKGYDVEFIVTGPDWEKLGDYSAEIKKQMKASPQLADVNDNYMNGLPELQVIPNRAKAAAEGVNLSDLGTVLGVLVGGYTFESVYYHESGHDNPIFIRMPPDQRLRPADLNHVYTRNNRGELVSVADVTTITQVPALIQITRDNRVRAISFLANASPTASGQEAMDAAMKIAKGVLPTGYSASLTGTSQAGSQTNIQLLITMGLGIIVAYMVLATQFNSFLQPWVILLALPFSITGAFAGLWLFNQSLNMYSLIGLILLLGLVKKNSIMIVSFTNQAREKGKNLTDALLYACPMRLRPILMTSFATVAGALPAAMALGPGSALRQPMSVAVIGGILFSTLLSLVVVPCAYSIMSAWERPDEFQFKKDSDGNLVADTRHSTPKHPGAHHD